MPAHTAVDIQSDYILVINSANFREEWTYKLYESIDETFSQKGSLAVYSESASVWHINTTEAIDTKLGYLRRKYPVPPKMVIAIGDPAWYLCRPLFDAEWHDVPTIICYGKAHRPTDINHFFGTINIPDSLIEISPKLIDGYNATCIQVPFAIKETLELMLSLLPEMKKIAFISDDRFICSLARRELNQVCKTYFPGISTEFLTYPNTNTESLLKMISECNKETGIIYYSWVNLLSANSDGSYYPHERIHNYISTLSSVPIFTLSDQHTQTGDFVGGSYIPLSEIIAATLHTIQEILDGKRADQITPRIAGTNRAHLNYQNLQTHGISSRLYPADAVYYDTSPSFWQKYAYHITIAIGICILTLLFLFMRRRIKRIESEQSIKEKEIAYRHETLIRNMPIIYFQKQLIKDADGKVTDIIVRDVNPAFENYFGIKKRNIVDKRFDGVLKKYLFLTL